MEPEVKLLRFLLENIVNNPNQINIQRTEDEQGIFLVLSVAEEDVALVIGHKGKVIKSLRTILKIRGTKDKQRITLKLLEKNSEEE